MSNIPPPPVPDPPAAVGTSSPAQTAALARFDASRRRRLWIALGVSLVVNFVIYSAAGAVGRQFLDAIRPKPTPPTPVSVTRIVLPPGVSPGQVPREKLAALVAEAQARADAKKKADEKKAGRPMPSPSAMPGRQE